MCAEWRNAQHRLFAFLLAIAIRFNGEQFLLLRKRSPVIIEIKARGTGSATHCTAIRTVKFLFSIGIIDRGAPPHDPLINSRDLVA
jgi:hypothetical protein